MSTTAPKFISIDNFAAGIHADHHYNAGPTVVSSQQGSIVVQGAATIQNTYRCCADRTGALVPLPRLTAGPTSDRLPTASNAASKYVSGRAASYLLDAAVMTDLYVEGEVTSPDPERAGIFTLHGQWYETDAFRWTVLARLHRLFDDAGTQDLMWAKGATPILSGQTSLAHLGGGNFTPFRARYLLDSNFTVQSMAWVVFGAPDFGSTPPAWVTGPIPSGELPLTDFDLTNGGNYPDYNSFRILGLFPDYDDLDTPKSKFLATAGFTAVTFLAVHQGRLIGLSRDHGDFGENPAGDTLGSITEHVHYSPQYDFDASLGVGAYEFGTFGEEKPYLSGFVASITADELILMKDRGGGILVRGSLNDPTVNQMPFAHSTHGVRAIPCVTPMGLVYGSRRGIYMWEGGETTKSISENLPGFFWDHTEDDGDTDLVYYGSRGRFAFWDPWVLVPNNFLYDTRLNGWWRLDKTSNDAAGGTKVALNCYDLAASTDKLYAFPYKLEARAEVPAPTPLIESAVHLWQASNAAAGVLEDTGTVGGHDMAYTGYDVNAGGYLEKSGSSATLGAATGPTLGPGAWTVVVVAWYPTTDGGVILFDTSDNFAGGDGFMVSGNPTNFYAFDSGYLNEASGSLSISEPFEQVFGVAVVSNGDGTGLVIRNDQSAAWDGTSVNLTIPALGTDVDVLDYASAGFRWYGAAVFDSALTAEQVEQVIAELGGPGEVPAAQPAEPGNDILWYTATPDALASSYSWQSQPLTRMTDRMVSVRDLRLFATNPNATAATITVTLTGFDHTGASITPVTTTFSLAGNSSRPQLLHKIVEPNFVASYIQVRIQADSNNTSLPAPKIHQLTVAVGDRANIPNI